MSADPKRRRFSIRLRMMLLLIFVAGLWMGWRVNKARQQQRAVAAIRDYGGFVHYDWEFIDDEPAPGREPSGPKWLRGLLGDDYFQEVAQVSLVYDDTTGQRYETTRTDDSVLVHLRGMNGLRFLLLHDGQATDAGLANLRGLTNLEGIWMWDARDLTDAGVAHLAGLNNLNTLHISNSKMADAGLAHLASLPKLESLSAQKNRFTDQGLEHVKRMSNLKALHIGHGTGEITDAGLAHLKGLPNLKVLWITEEGPITKDGIASLQATMPKLKTIRWCY